MWIWVSVWGVVFMWWWSWSCLSGCPCSPECTVKEYVFLLVVGSPRGGFGDESGPALSLGDSQFFGGFPYFFESFRGVP